MIAKDILDFLHRARGIDLATVTSPPFLLAPLSVVEVGSCWTERPWLFAAPALEPLAERRAFLVLRWVLLSLKRQFYAGEVGNTGTIKKPLNAFLGELFIGSWSDEDDDGGSSGFGDVNGEPKGGRTTTDRKATTHLVVEQVSHHPPTTACYLWDAENGISAEAFSRVKMVFNTGFGAGDVSGLGVDICQEGHGTVRIDRFAEHHLMAAPRARVKGLLTGRLYPELVGTSYIVSSSGFVSEIRFSPSDAKRGVIGWLGGGGGADQKNRLEASIYRQDDPDKKPLYTVSGQWSGVLTFTDARTGEALETHDLTRIRTRPMRAPPREDMDPWETRRAWGPTIDALRAGDMVEAARRKTELEKAQREMRVREKEEGGGWTPLFFKRHERSSEMFERLSSKVNWFSSGKGESPWYVDEEKARNCRRPFRDGMTPYG